MNCSRFVSWSAKSAGIAISALALAQPCLAQDWTDAPIDKAARMDFEAPAPQEPNLYLLPLEVGPAQRFDFTANSAYAAPERVNGAGEIVKADAADPRTPPPQPDQVKRP